MLLGKSAGASNKPNDEDKTFLETKNETGDSLTYCSWFLLMAPKKLIILKPELQCSNIKVTAIINVINEFKLIITL
jgi:hypothetical protein